MDEPRMQRLLEYMDRRAIYLISIASKEDINTLISSYLDDTLKMGEEAISIHGLELINEYMDKYEFKPIELKVWNYGENYAMVNRFMVTLSSERTKRFSRSRKTN